MHAFRAFAAVTAGLWLASAAPAQVVVWDNGNLSTGATSRSGVTAPAGTTWSEVPLGSTSAGATGSPGTAPAFRLADNFTLSSATTLLSITAFGYSTGAAESAVFTTGNLQIWSGRPGDLGSTVVFGDTTTNRVIGSSFTNIYRIFGTTALPGGTMTAPGTTRSIKSVVFDTPITLAPGDYWIDFQVTPITGFANSFFPAVTPANGDRTVAGANGRQLVAAGWQDLLDTGSPATEPDVNLDLPFVVTAVPEPSSLALVGAAGLVVFRRIRRRTV